MGSTYKTLLILGAAAVVACSSKSDPQISIPDAGPGMVNSPGSTTTHDFTSVSAGVWHTCGLKTDGTIVCWGVNNFGESTPPPGTFTAVSAGEFFSCGLKTDGTIACWGDNTFKDATPPSGTFSYLSAASGAGSPA